MLEFF
jgi:hypothetical protein